MLKRSPWLLLCLYLSLCLVSCAAHLAERKSKAEASRRLGEGYLGEGNATAALKELLKAEKLYEKDAFLQNDLGLAYFAKKEFDLAIAHFKKALAIKPDYPEALNNMGTVYLRLKQWDDAIECFNRAHANLLYTTPHFALSNLGEAYRGKKDYRRAIVFYKKALEINPRFPEAHRGLGLTYIATGNYKGAVSSLEKAVQYAPYLAPAYYDLGRARARQYDTEKAISAFKKVVELVPETPLAKQALAEIRKLQR
ncbi:MAG: tetratricopeptide repeat protein [Deltaproteobacteria bacterium]|nr:tetratricopeptide repeat protein [Deltaproteobacteria bacterium]MBW2075529.1 tetratricopeptide repeat protein [Deltaproteobacteria bacterium]RLB81348.1 MAG: hypothetical protein DRH17_09370 [Deltaproteobacteria bacterium]